MYKLLSNPWVLLGLVGVLLFAGLGIYRSGYGEGKADCEFAVQQAVIAEQERRDQANDKINKVHNDQLGVDEEQNNADNDKALGTPVNVAECLPPDAVNRLR